MLSQKPALPPARIPAALRGLDLGLSRRSGRSAVGAGTRRSYHWAKRSIDLLLASLLIVFLSPLLLLIAVLIVLDSGRPVFFRQTRVGSRPRRAGRVIRWEQREFRIVKFRTMFVRADESPVHEEFIRAFIAGDVSPAGDGRSAYKLPNDRRVTRVGRVLRATSLDELPQLFNVVRGTMSLIGPRPLPTYEHAACNGRFAERLSALPGISGLWQVDGRSSVPFEQMMAMDIQYVERQSLWLDANLLIRTIPAVLSRRGAR